MRSVTKSDVAIETDPTTYCNISPIIYYKLLTTSKQFFCLEVIGKKGLFLFQNEQSNKN